MTAIITMVLFFALWGGFLTFTVGFVWLTGGLRRGGWRATEAGRLIAALCGTVSWILTLGVVRLVWPGYPGRTGIVLASYAALVVVSWWMVSLLWRRQRERRQKEGVVMINSFKLKPVAWLTAFYGLLGAVLAANQVFHLLPSTVAAWIGFVGTVLGIVLGVKAYSAVTPLANPKTSQGYPLAPVPPVGDGDPSLR